ncbi:diguanylate cyclase [Sphingomonas rhizophila]|uniref:diguanylate cyclase n=1 Tax=Sphingomonas rhizophila TaxID=2071607 RepID=A0A7G9SAX4_9SPHN|nr:GGDEF domain-containing protein [Sphingomonas rhizophila]QNN64999.1 diguanylate cyclase [Sphingomonas rhizophila]
MHDISLESRPPGELLEEIARLRGELARLEARIEDLDRLAHLDTLVPLSNRRGMLRDLDRMIARFNRNGTPAALLFVDLDDLKTLNDCFGHSGGDAALVHVAEQLLAGTRANDCVARLGGDEFCVLLDDADEAGAIEIAERMVDAIAGDDFLFDGMPMPLSVAIGVTTIMPGDTPQSLLARADQAMYRVKSADAA